MKRYSIQKFVILCVFILFTLNVKSQKIDLTELQNFSSKSPETANTLLLTNGWEFIGAKSIDDFSTLVRWEFIPQGSNGIKNLIELTTSQKQPNSVRYQFNQKEYYLQIMSEFSANGYKLIEDNIANQVVSATYEAENFVLLLNYKRDNHEGKEFTSYEVTIKPKSKSIVPKQISENTSDKKREYDANGVLIAEFSLKDGKREGPATYFYPDGSVKKESQIKAGFENGPAIVYDYDPKNKKLLTKTTGIMLNDKPEGIWLKNKIVENTLLPIEMITFEEGIKQGEFHQVQNDSVILMRYKNDMLEGYYRVFLHKTQNLKVSDIDTTQMIRVTHGFYVENKKIGLWKNFDTTGSLIEEGYLLNDAKTGIWKYYYPSTAYDSNIPTAYSGKLYLEETYKSTKRNGESIRYSSLKKEEMPCSTENNKKCYLYKFEDFTEKSTLVNDILDGEYELTDPNNTIIAKGVYMNGKQIGKWVLLNDSRLVKRPSKTIEKGSFQDGIKEGKWERFDAKNELVETYKYKDGILHGDYFLYKSSTPIEKYHFENANITELAALDSQQNPLVRYTFTDRKEDSYTCQKLEKNANGVCVKTFNVKNAAPKEDNVFTFKEDFELMPENLRILNGPYSLKDSESNVIEEGSYTGNQKVGRWTNFYYDQRVRTDFVYEDGVVTAEHYFDLKKNEPFSGEFIFKEANSDTSEERKIKDGLRNGTTRFKDSKDKTIKKESYKKGLLKE